jgi:hypothetical protein
MCGVHVQYVAVVAAAALLSREYAAPTCYAIPLIPVADSTTCLMRMHPASKYAILPSAQDLVHFNQDPTRDAPLPAALSEWRQHCDSCFVHPMFLICACSLGPLVYDGQRLAHTVILVKGDQSFDKR